MSSTPAQTERDEQIAAGTRATVEELLARMAAGDAERTAALFADEIDFRCAGSATVPWIRPRRTRADMADFFATMDASFVPEDRAATLAAFLVDGAQAVVTGEVSQRLRSNGRAFTTPFALHLTVTDGRISGYRVYEDSLVVAEAVAG